MTLTELRYIVAVARERHFGRAAESCFVSQPTLSVAVRKLEDELGVTLFERDPGDVRTTSIGAAIVDQAQRVLEESAKIKQLAIAGQDELAGVLRMGAIYTIGPYLLPDLIPLLRASAPQMPLLIEENFTAVLAERLRHGELDAIVISQPFSEPGVLTMDLYQEPFEVLLPADHRLANQERVSNADLAREDLLLLGPGHCFRDQVLQYCPECNRASVTSDSMQRTLEGGSLETIRLMVASGMGLTVLPRSALRTSIEGSTLVVTRPFAEPVPHRIVSLAWRKSFPRPKAIQAVADAIRQCPMAGVTMVDKPGAAKLKRPKLPQTA